jgi:hypothetical protein
MEARHLSWALDKKSNPRRGVKWSGNTKSELGAIATSRTLNFPEVGAPVWVVIS